MNHMLPHTNANLHEVKHVNECKHVNERTKPQNISLLIAIIYFITAYNNRVKRPQISWAVPHFSISIEQIIPLKVLY